MVKTFYGASLKKNGFTIVELLIVIVVIGILAALVMNTFSGVQQRARNAQRISAVIAWTKIINVYLQQNGQYPPPYNGTTDEGHCLGTGFTDFNSDGIGDCWGITSFMRSESVTVNAAFATISPKLPSTYANPIPLDSAGSDRRAGPHIDKNNARGLVRSDGNFEIKPYQLIFYLEGDATDCQFQSTLERTNDVPSAFHLRFRYSLTGYSYTSGAGTECIIQLPNPEDV